MSKFSIIFVIILLLCQLAVAETNIGFLGFEKTDSSSGALVKSMNGRDMKKVSEAYPDYKINDYKEAKKILKKYGVKSSLSLGMDKKMEICKELGCESLIWGQVGSSADKGAFDVTAFMLIVQSGDLKQYRFTVTRKSSERIEALKKELFDKVAEASTEKLARLLNLAQQFIDSENYNDAIAKLNEYLTMDKKNTDVYSLLGFSYLQQQKVNDAINTYESGISENGNDEFLVSGLVDSYFAAGKFDEAKEALAPIAESTDNKEYWFRLGQINEKLFDSMEAADCYEKALEIDENYMRAAYQLGLLKYNEAEFEEAIPYLEMVSAEFPDDNDIASKLAKSYQQSGQTEAAIDNLKEIISGKPDVMSNYIKLASAYMNLARTDFNEGMYDSAIEANNKGIATLDDVKDKFGNHVDIREKTAELYAYNSKIFKEKGNTAKQKENAVSAINIYKTLESDSDEKFDIYMKISRLYYNINQFNNATDYVKKAQQVEADAFSAYMFDYKIQYKIGLGYYNKYNQVKNKIDEGNMYGDELNSEIEKRDNLRKQSNSKFNQCKKILQKAVSVGMTGEKNEAREEIKTMNKYIDGTKGSFE